ncbi:MAG: hypothetical protein AAFV93_07305 [Chloroflexota bacterium]
MLIEAQRDFTATKNPYTGDIPQTIPLNIIDRVFFVPQGNDYHGDYFPTSFARVTRLKYPVPPEAFVHALKLVDDRFPQLRIGYRINPEQVVLERVPDHERDAYFESLVRPLYSNDSSDDIIADLISHNTEPLGSLINIFYRDDELYIKMFHIIGDARHLATFTHYYFTALFMPEQFEKLPALEDNFWSPIWKIIWHHPQQAFNILSRTALNVAQRVWRFVRELVGTKKPTVKQLERNPMVSGSPVGVITSIVEEDGLQALFEARKHIIPDEKISLNNLMLIELAMRLQRKGYLKQKVTYSIPVDLRRYREGDKAFYPGNLVSQIRVTINQKKPAKIARLLQQRTAKQLKRYTPLVGMPFEWVMNLLPRKVYDGLHQSWSLNRHLNPERFFVLSNVGSLDKVYGRFGEFVDLNMHGALAPMDTPLIVILSTIEGRGQISTSFDPNLISHDDVRDIIDFNNQPLLILEERSAPL